MGMVITQSREPLKTAARSLTTLIEKNSEHGILLLLPGGSAAQILDHIEFAHPERITFGLTDERFTIDPKYQNVTLLEEKTALKKATGAGAHFISMIHKDLSLHESVMRYEEQLVEWRTHHPHGKTIAVLGVGADAHVAGMLPHPDEAHDFHALFEGEQLVQGYDSASKSEFPFRITVTRTFLETYTDAVVVYMSGEQKKEALAHLMMPFGDVHVTPARMVRSCPRVFVYTDVSL